MNERPQEPSSDVPVPQSDLGWMQSMIAAKRQRQFYAAQRSSISMVVGPPPPLDTFNICHDA
jgi:hypothetical protein